MMNRLTTRTLQVIWLMTLPTTAATQPREMLALANRVLTKVQAYQSNPGSAPAQSATGYWKFERAPYPITQMALGEVVLTSGISRNGDLFSIGYGEGRMGRWQGWWGYSCRGCCEGEAYWAPGVQVVSDDRKRAVIELQGRKIDPDTCEQTETPDTIRYELTRVSMLRFREHLPGKVVHIVMSAAPARFRASVKIAWNARFEGVKTVTVATKGRKISDRSSNLVGEYEHLTSQAGKLSFLLAAYDKRGRPIHAEIISVQVPRIGN